MVEKADLTLLVVALDEELYQRVVSAAARDGISASDFAMLAIANYLGGANG